MKIRALRVLFVTLLIPLFLFGCSGTSVPAEYRASYDLLREAPEFANDGVGVAGGTPTETSAFKEIFESEHAKELFIKLESEATAAGRLYALCALYKLDKALFDSLIVKYALDDEPVVYRAGCIGVHTTIKELVNDEDSDWDISGGAIPESLLMYISYLH